MHNGDKHADVGNVYGFASEQKHQGGRYDGCHDGGAGGHAYGKSHIAFRKVGHHVRRRAAGAAPHEYHAHGQFGRKLERHAQDPCQKGHDNELGEDAHDHGLRLGEHHLEVACGKGHAHTEHHDAQKRVDPTGGQRRVHGIGNHKGNNGNEQGYDGHPFPCKSADLLKNLHGLNPLFFWARPVSCRCSVGFAAAGRYGCKSMGDGCLACRRGMKFELHAVGMLSDIGESIHGASLLPLVEE